MHKSEAKKRTREPAQGKPAMTARDEDALRVLRALTRDASARPKPAPLRLDHGNRYFSS